jgi:hypothetical protein
MTTDLLGHEPPDAEDFVVSWLQPWIQGKSGQAGIERKADSPPLFAIVEFIDGTDSIDHGTEDGVVQVDFLAPAGTAAEKRDAKLFVREGHRRMMYLAKHIPDVEMSDGSTANCDYLTTMLKPKRMDYANEKVVRYTARYALGLSYVAV